MTEQDLSWLTEDEIQALNQRINQGAIKSPSGHVQKHPLRAGLKVQGKDIFYPVQDDIFYLLTECALVGESFDAGAQLDPSMKAQVKKFYDEFGWQEKEGVYQDAKDSEDLRAISQEYIERCHLRLNRFLPQQGEYLLDVASGPVQYPAYLSYSKHYAYRICADISIAALKEAKKKLGDKGLYLLCDVTKLPIKTNAIDACVSLHTLYHVPANEQAKAFAEIYRAIKPGGVSVIVYSWGGKSLLMNLLMFPHKLLAYIKRKLFTPTRGESLYFHAHSYDWFCQEIQAKYKTELYAWRSVNVPFLKSFVHQALAGRHLLKLFYFLEEKAPKLMGRIGAYPLFVSKKPT